MAEQHHYPPLIEGDGEFNVLMICSLKAYKGINEFIEIAALCLGTSKIQFTLLLNAKQQDIDDFFKAEKLPDNITLVPQQKNVFPYYTQASLLLNLSRPDEWVETFGLTIIEAMAFAIPVIVPPVGGPIEIVTDGQEGYLISCYETDKIAEKIMSEIESLPPQEYMKLVHWFSERDWDKWDVEIEEDSKSGKLDFLFEEASQAKINMSNC